MFYSSNMVITDFSKLFWCFWNPLILQKNWLIMKMRPRHPEKSWSNDIAYIMVWGCHEWLVEHIYLKNLRNLCRNEWETIVWSLSHNSCKVVAVPTILKMAINKADTSCCPSPSQLRVPNSSWNTTFAIDVNDVSIWLSHLLDPSFSTAPTKSYQSHTPHLNSLTFIFGPPNSGKSLQTRMVFMRNPATCS